MTRESGLQTNMRHKDIRLDTKNLSDDGTFEGYGSVFGVEDSYGDIVERGAFQASLEEHKSAGTMPALLWQHDPHQPIGVYTEMGEDQRGLKVRGRITLETQLGREAHALVKAGALNGLSIGYMVKRYEHDSEAQTLKLLEIDLWEVSLVTFPANAQSRVADVKRSDRISDLADWKSFEAVLRDEGRFSGRAAAAMVASARRIRDAEREARDAMASIAASTEKLQKLISS